ncbi:polysaccharide deacetylase family protein [Aquihabitans daechungensis]|uniref:polysaccharide deacetylase family protein n=1 Tax=Aquihabitans daechungensis TaxID=1052257 RepID=UPI003BA24864
MSALALAYHGVSLVPFDQDRYRLFTAPAALDRQIRLLQRWGYELATFGDWAERVGRLGPKGAGRVATLTFDDGFADNRSELLPVLAARGVPATVFVVGGWLGSTHPDAPGAPILTADDVVALHQAGVEIGGHAMGHVDLRSVPDDSLAADLSECRALLSGLIDAPVTSFAYPFGDADDRVRAAVRAAGFTAACRTSGEGSWSDPFDLPRQAMGNGSSALGLRLKRADRYEAVIRWPGAARLRRASRRAHNRAEGRRAAASSTSPQQPAA